MSKIIRFQPYFFILLAAGFLYYWPQGFLYYWSQGFYILAQTLLYYSTEEFLYFHSEPFISNPKHFLTINKQEKRK